MGGSFARYLHVIVDLEGVVEVEEVLHLVVGDAAVDHRLLARVNDDERKLEVDGKNKRQFGTQGRRQLAEQ